MMREINDRRLASSKVKPTVITPTPAPATNEAALIPLPVSPDPDTVSSRSVESAPSPAAPAPLADITDLLADSAPPALDAAAPIEPSTSSASPSQLATAPPALSQNISEPAVILDDEVETQEEGELETTIRSMEGDGTTGAISVDHESTLVEKEDDTAEPETEAGDEEHSATASTNSEFKKTHEKKNSSLSSSLKKIGSLGEAGTRRKDSNTSAKDITV